jgi:hypothetical protein
MDLLWPRITEEQKLAAYEEATKLLNERIEKIMDVSANTVLTDLEKTHILCVPTTVTTIPMGKIYTDRIDNIRGELTFNGPDDALK